MRGQQAARKRGYELTELRARQITQSDFHEYDLILAMDWENLTLFSSSVRVSKSTSFIC